MRPVPTMLPGLPQKVRDAGMELPKPTSPHDKKSKGQRGAAPEEFTLKGFSRSILDAIGRAIKH